MRNNLRKIIIMFIPLLLISVSLVSTSSQGDVIIDPTPEEPASVTVVSPNGGESWEIGEQYDISWSFTGEISSVVIELMDIVATGDPYVITPSGTPCDGSYLWVVPSDVDVGSAYLIRITPSDGSSDSSDSVFSIIAGGVTPEDSITVVFPNGGEIWMQQDCRDIAWDYTGDISFVSIELWNGSSRDSVISAITECDGIYQWIIPAEQTYGESYRILIKDFLSAETFDFSNDTFIINNYDTAVDPRSITITRPTSLDTWFTGENSYTIEWEYTGEISIVDVDIYKGDTKIETISENCPVETGSVQFSPGAQFVTGFDYYIKIIDYASDTFDVSEYFTIINGGTPSDTLKVTYPNGGQSLSVPFGEEEICYDIFWDPGIYATEVTIQLLKAGTVDQTIANGIDNSGLLSKRFCFTKEKSGDDFQIKIYNFYNPDEFDISDNYFSINMEDDNLKPSSPINPDPNWGATKVKINIGQLSWEGGDSPPSATVPANYTVYFKKDTKDFEETDILCEDILTKECSIDVLEYSSTYYWQVVAKNPHGETSGYVWYFKTSIDPVDRPYIRILPSSK